MKKSGKALLMMLSAAALVVTTVFGTIAYFTDSEGVVNTFTVGQVHLGLDEADVKPDGTYETDAAGNKLDRVLANVYHLIPGQTYVKDPTVHVTAGSEDCYVFVTVDNQIADIEWNDDDTYKSIKEQMNDKGWEELKDNGETVVTGENELTVYVYYDSSKQSNVVSKSDTVTNLVVFEEFKIDGNNVISSDIADEELDNMFYLDDYSTKKIMVNAYAVQAAGFDSALEAWNATYGKSSN